MCKGAYENSIVLIIRMSAPLSDSASETAGTSTCNTTGR
jgi:hypothetical protein